MQVVVNPQDNHLCSQKGMRKQVTTSQSPLLEQKPLELGQSVSHKNLLVFIVFVCLLCIEYKCLLCSWLKLAVVRVEGTLGSESTWCKSRKFHHRMPAQNLPEALILQVDPLVANLSFLVEFHNLQSSSWEQRGEQKC